MRKNFLIIYLFFLPIFGFANDDNDIIKISYSQYPPFEYLEDGRATGFTVEMLTEIFKAAGYKPEFISFPWKRALEVAKDGEIDVLTHLKKSEEREQYFIYSDPILYSGHYFFKKKSLDIHPTSFADLNNYSIATVNGYFYSKEFEDAKLEHLVPISSSEPIISNLKKLAAGRVDLIICQLNVCNYLIDKHKEEFADIDYITSLPIDVSEPTYVAFPKANLARSEHLLKVFNAGLKEYIASGKKAKLITKYDLEGVK